MPDNPRSTASIAGHPIHAMLVPIPITCFLGALITDIAYVQTLHMQWANFSAWLLMAGLIGAAFAAIAGLTDFFGDKRIRRLGAAWLHGLGNVVAVSIAAVNLLVHSRDGYTSVMPLGLVLSAGTVLILLGTGWLGGALVYRHRVGVLSDKS